MKTQIVKLTAATRRIYNEVCALLDDLYGLGRGQVSFETFNEIIQGGAIVVYISLYQENVVGTATLANYKKLAGWVWVIEDVVVNERFRGRGVGSDLIRRLLADACEAGAQCVDVYTRHERASVFYRDLDFRDKNSERPFFALRYQF